MVDKLSYPHVMVMTERVPIPATDQRRYCWAQCRTLERAILGLVLWAHDGKGDEEMTVWDLVVEFSDLDRSLFVGRSVASLCPSRLSGPIFGSYRHWQEVAW